MSRERILVIDDEPGMLRAVERVLEQRYEVHCARTQAEALALATEAKPDLAVLDVRMPEMDGFQLMSRLREVSPGIDVIFMTGVTHELDAQIIRSIRERAYYFIQKPFDRELLLTLVQRCLELRKLAADNRRHVERLERELEQARRFQQGLLPPPLGRFGRIEVAASYRPCEALGGDFYDYARGADGSVSLLIADVSGHGVSAAMLTAIVKSCFHDARDEGRDPLAVVRRIAGAIRSLEANRFVSTVCVRIDPTAESLDYVNGGHPPGIVWGTSRAPHWLAPTGPIVSPVLADLGWERVRCRFGEGDRLLLYTDGLTEAQGAAGEYGTARLHDALLAAPAGGPALVEHVLESVTSHAGGRPAEDDRTLITAGSGA